MKLIKVFKFLFIFMFLFIIFYTMNIGYKIFRTSFVFSYLDFCVQGSCHYLNKFITDSGEEFVFLPNNTTNEFTILLKESANEKNKDNSEFKIDTYITKKSQDITNQYIKSITGYSIDDMIQFLDDTNPANK